MLPGDSQFANSVRSGTVAIGAASLQDSFGTPDEVAWIITVHPAPASRVTVSFPNQLAGFHPILEVAGFARLVAIEVRLEGLE